MITRGENNPLSKISHNIDFYICIFLKTKKVFSVGVS